MRLALGRAGWALTAAGTLGLSVAAAPAFLEKAEAATPPPASASTAVEGGFARLLEIRVELAWLADPQTCPYDLAAHSAGNALEVGGQVPSGAVRDHALQVAREQTALPVVDRLLIHPKTGNPVTKMSDANLCRAAGEALGRLLAGHKERFEVSADGSGQVALLGTVPSCEEKLRISRRVSQLAGCTSVINSMVVARVVRDGQIFTPISADGAFVVAGDPLDLLPPPAAPVPSQPVIVKAPYKQIPADAPNLNAGVVVGEPARIHPESNIVIAAPQPKQTVVRQTQTPKVQTVASATVTAPTAPSQQVVYVAPMAAFPPVSPYQGAVGTSMAQYPTPASTPATTYALRPVILVQASQPPALAAAPTAQQAGRLTPYASPNGSIVLASATETKSSSNHLVQAVAHSATMPTANNGASPAVKTAPPAAKPAVPSNEPAKIAEPAKPLTANQDHIKRLIEAACGDAARDVELKVMGENRLNIALRVRSASEGARLGERILMMPELEPYKVDLAMEVKQ